MKTADNSKVAITKMGKAEANPDPSFARKETGADDVPGIVSAITLLPLPDNDV
jgi:hypothetical protein